MPRHRELDTAIFQRRRAYRELAEEVEQHIAEKIEELKRNGMPAQDALYAHSLLPVWFLVLNIGPLAHLHAGVTVRQAQARFAALDAVNKRGNRSNSDISSPVHAQLLQQKMFGTIRATLLLLWGSGVCLLAIACANVRSLMLARASAGHHEISVCVALGASLWRIARHSDLYGRAAHKGDRYSDCAWSRQPAYPPTGFPSEFLAVALRTVLWRTLVNVAGTLVSEPVV